MGFFGKLSVTDTFFFSLKDRPRLNGHTLCLCLSRRSALLRAIELSPADHRVYIGRGVLKRDLLQDPGGASEDLNKAIELHGGDHEAHAHRALLCAGAGDVQGALANFDTALRLAPRDAKTLANRAVWPRACDTHTSLRGAR